MTHAVGSQNYLARIVETTWGTTPSTPQLTELKKTAHSIGLKKSLIESQTIRSDRQIADARHGQRTVSGDIEVEFCADDYDDLIESAFMSSIASNTLKIGSTIKSFTVEDGQTDIGQYMAYTGITVDTMELSLKPNEIAKLKFGVIGKDMTVSSSPLDAALTAASAQSPFTPFTGTITEGGSTLAIVTGIDLKLSNNLKSAFVINNTSAPSVISGKARVEGTLTAYFDNATLLNKFVNETSSSLVFSLTDGLSGNTYTFTIPKVKYSGGDKPLNNDQERLLTLPFIGLYDTVEATTLKMVKS